MRETSRRKALHPVAPTAVRPKLGGSALQSPSDVDTTSSPQTGDPLRTGAFFAGNVHDMRKAGQQPSERVRIMMMASGSALRPPSNIDTQAQATGNGLVGMPMPAVMHPIQFAPPGMLARTMVGHSLERPLDSSYATTPTTNGHNSTVSTAPSTEVTPAATRRRNQQFQHMYQTTPKPRIFGFGSAGQRQAANGAAIASDLMGTRDEIEQSHSMQTVTTSRQSSSERDHSEQPEPQAVLSDWFFVPVKRSKPGGSGVRLKGILVQHQSKDTSKDIGSAWVSSELRDVGNKPKTFVCLSGSVYGVKGKMQHPGVPFPKDIVMPCRALLSAKWPRDIKFFQRLAQWVIDQESNNTDATNSSHGHKQASNAKPIAKIAAPTSHGNEQPDMLEDDIGSENSEQGHLARNAEAKTEKSNQRASKATSSSKPKSTSSTRAGRKSSASNKAHPNQQSNEKQNHEREIMVRLSKEDLERRRRSLEEAHAFNDKLKQSKSREIKSLYTPSATLRTDLKETDQTINSENEKTGSYGTSSTSEGNTTRSGRIRRKPLEFWKNERLMYNADKEVVAFVPSSTRDEPYRRPRTSAIVDNHSSHSSGPSKTRSEARKPQSVKQVQKATSVENKTIGSKRSREAINTSAQTTLPSMPKAATGNKSKNGKTAKQTRVLETTSSEGESGGSDEITDEETVTVVNGKPGKVDSGKTDSDEETITVVKRKKRTQDSDDDFEDAQKTKRSRSGISFQPAARLGKQARKTGGPKSTSVLYQTPAKAGKRYASEQNINLNSSTGEDWGQDDLARLLDAVSVAPAVGASNGSLWSVVGEQLGRSATSCRNRFFSEQATPLPAAKKSRGKTSGAVKKGTKANVKVARQGTVRRRTQLREAYELGNEGHEDDMFESTPWRKQLNKTKKDSKSTDGQNQEDVELPLMAFLDDATRRKVIAIDEEQEDEDPQGSSPGLLRSVKRDRKQLDAYIVNLRKKSRVGSKQAKAAVIGSQKSKADAKDVWGKAKKMLHDREEHEKERRLAQNDGSSEEDDDVEGYQFSSDED